MSDSDSNSSSSQLDNAQVESLLGIDFHIIGSNAKPFDQMITIKTDVNYDEMLADLYKPLYKRLSLHGDPCFLKQKECIRSIFVELFLAETLHLAKQNNDIFSCKKVQLEAQCPLLEEMNIVNVSKDIADFVVSLDGGAIDSKPKVIVEVSESVYEGLPLCFLCMEHAYRTNGDGKTVYGIYTNAHEWIICSYQGKLPPTTADRSSDWQISKRIEAFDGIESEESWKAGSGATLAKLLYSIFDEQIKFLKESEQMQVNPVLNYQERYEQVQKVLNERMEKIRKEQMKKMRNKTVRKWLKLSMNPNNNIDDIK